MDDLKDNPLLGFFIIGAIIFLCMYQENTNLRKDCGKLNTQVEELKEQLDDANNDAVSYEFLYCNAIHHRSKQCIISLKEWQEVDPTGEVRRDILKEYNGISSDKEQKEEKKNQVEIKKHLIDPEKLYKEIIQKDNAKKDVLVF